MAELIATFAAGIWAGASFYIGFAEHPSALKVGVHFATEYFRHMSRRTAPMMMVLALIGAVAGILAWIKSGSSLWLIGAILLAAMFPFTVIFIVPTNLKLLKVDAQNDPDEAAALHARWDLMHTWRTVAGSLAFALFLWALGVGQDSLV